MILHLDFETRSELELPDVGIHKYAAHPSTDVWCVGYAIDDGEPVVVRPDNPGIIPLLKQADRLIAHNAYFEIGIWKGVMTPRYQWPETSIEQWSCTMARAYAMGLPGSLEKAAAAMGIPQQKDLQGGRLAVQMSRPHPKWDPRNPFTQKWWDDDERRAKLEAYCAQDVRVEQELHRRLFELTPFEHRVWAVDYAINERGVAIDRAGIARAQVVLDHEQTRLSEEIRAVTQGAVGSPAEIAALKRWVESRGVVVSGLAKADILELLDRDDLPSDVRRALLIRQESGRTSTAKLPAMMSACSDDGRVRHIIQYCGAGTTGRFAGRRIQPQNMPRPRLPHDQIDAVLWALTVVVPVDQLGLMLSLYGPPMSVLADCLRGLLVAKLGHEFVCADFSNIEGRVVAWLAGEQWKLDAFAAQDAKTGPEVYILTAAKIYNVSPSALNKKSPERQIGKVAELALGFGGGPGAFLTMAKNYPGVNVSHDQADVIKQQWRAAHPKIQQLWWDVETAAMNAVEHPGVRYRVNDKIAFKTAGSFLFCQLPSKRVLCYPYPELKPTETPWGEMKDQIHYKHVDGLTRKWGETHTYGGKLVENITQAVSRDLLVDRLVAVHDRGLPIVLHVHDEIVIETPIGSVPVEALEGYLRQTPEWAKGLPMNAEGWAGRRYRK